MSADSPVRPFRAALTGASWLCAHGALLALSLPPFGAWPLAFVSLVPVVLAARAISRIPLAWQSAAGVGLLPFWLFTHLWTVDVTVAGYLPLCVIVALISHLSVIAISHLERRGVASGVSLAVCWTLAEYVRGTLAFDGYPWAFVSHPLIEWWPAASPAIGSSIYAVTFLLAFLQGQAVECFGRKPIRPALSVIACIIAWCAFGRIAATEQTSSRRIRIAAIQTNVPQSNKLGWNLDQQLEDWRDMRALAIEAIQGSPDLVVWPETMIPGITLSPQANAELAEKQVVYRTQDGRTVAADFFASDLLRLQRESGIPMLVGDEGVDQLRVNEIEGSITLDFGKRFNSVFLVDRGAVTDRYDKIHLTPFGEVMPYIRAWPWLQRQLLSIGAAGMSFSLSEGSDSSALEVPMPQGEPPVRAVTPICFESTDHALIRKMVYGEGRRLADLLVFITNDGWFGDQDMIRSQHLQAARWRCLETATPGVRAANTGVCAIIDSRGRLMARGIDGDTNANRRPGVLTGVCDLPGSEAPPRTVPASVLLVLLLFFRRAKAD